MRNKFLDAQRNRKEVLKAYQMYWMQNEKDLDMAYKLYDAYLVADEKYEEALKKLTGE